MTDLEDRVRRTLHGMADSVPPSAHARAGFQRRITRRRRLRGTTLVATAAAAVVAAAVVIPVALNRTVENHGIATTPVTTGPPKTAPATPGSGTEDDPWVVTGFTENGVRKEALFWLTSGEQRMCTGVRPRTGKDPAPFCEPVPPTWPVVLGPGPGTNVVTRTVLGDYIRQTGPVPLRDWLVFVTSPEVARLEVRAGDGTVVRSTGGFHTVRGVTFGFYDFGGPPWGFGYTAYDDQGGVVESAIT
jgi:hypothetical protein